VNPAFINSPDFHQQLFNIDIDTARRIQATGCQHCGSKLHRANYPRKGFGIPVQIAQFYSLRLSFCCASCRRRSTPPSVRFFGRYRYVAMIFVLLCALRFSPSEHRCIRLANRYGLCISLATWKRWLSWWHNEFTNTPLWVDLKAHFPLSLLTPARTLLKQLGVATLQGRLQQALLLLSPLNHHIK